MAGQSNQANRIRELWWVGVRLWYNEQDFMAAMEVWKDTIDSVEWSDDNGRTSILPDPEEPFLSGDASTLAPLLLFLAGCYLDAGDTTTARTFCRRCISTQFFRNSLTSGSENSVFAHEALSEYIATFQEDEDTLEPWKTAYQIADWAIKEVSHDTLSLTATTGIWTDPYQRPFFFYPSLSSKAVYPREEHPSWCKTLEGHYSTIRDEYERLLRGNHDSSITSMPRHWPRVGAGEHRDGAGQHDASVVQTGGDWREIVLFGSGARPDLAPNTCRILKQYAPEAVDLAQEGAGEIIFSVLAPQTHIAPHCASTNLRLTAHLGLQVPDNCFIQVEEEKMRWQEGQILVFDDSYQHEVHNQCNEIRAVLLMRFWHPNLSMGDRIKALQHVLAEKETDRMRRCNPPLPTTARDSKIVNRHPQGMSKQMCQTCGRSGFETIRLLDPEDGMFGCICGQQSRG